MVSKESQERSVVTSCCRRERIDNPYSVGKKVEKERERERLTEAGRNLAPTRFLYAHGILNSPTNLFLSAGQFRTHVRENRWIDLKNYADWAAVKKYII